MASSSSTPLEAVVVDDVTPESVDPDEIRMALQSERPLVRQRGARVCATLAEDDIDAVRPFVAELGAVLHDDNAGVAQTAAAALQDIGAVDVDAVADIIDDVAALTQSDLPGLQLAGAQLLADVAAERPGACEPVVDTLLDSLDRPRTTTTRDSLADHVDDRETQQTIHQYEQEEQEYEQVARQLVSNVVVAVADERPASVTDQVETVADLLTRDDAAVRGAALDVLGTLAQETPATVDPVADSVVACLDAEGRVVKARAVRVLGFLDDERYADSLRAVADTTDDDELAAFAEETAAFLE